MTEPNTPPTWSDEDVADLEPVGDLLPDDVADEVVDGEPLEPLARGQAPPEELVALTHGILRELLEDNPAATSSEAYVRSHLELALLRVATIPRYFLRIGINYHGAKVQHIQLDQDSGVLVGWNPKGDALGTGRRAKVLLAGATIFDRDPDEPMMNDSKIGGGCVPAGRYVRIEFKVRGYLGQTKNLDGKQLEKDIDLLKEDRADLMVVCLSETAHRKWRGEGPRHQAERRTGTSRFAQLLVSPWELPGTDVYRREIDFEGQRWVVTSQRVVGADASTMPGAEHYVTCAWRAPIG